MRIIDHGGRFINLQYDLETGGLERCNRNGPWAEDFSEIGFFIEDSCAGAPYAGFGSSAITNSSHTASRRLDFVDGDIWYVTEDECVEDISGSYWTIFEPKECLPLRGGAGCPFKPVPEWVRELLPNPPYSMAVEYD